MSPVGFEPTIPARERPQTYALDRSAIGPTGEKDLEELFLLSHWVWNVLVVKVTIVT